MTDYERKAKPIKHCKLSDTSLIESFDLKNGIIVRVENDDWGKFIRVVEGEYTIFSKLIIDEENLERYVKEVKLRYS
jgi:hypothetical protein